MHIFHNFTTYNSTNLKLQYLGKIPFILHLHQSYINSFFFSFPLLLNVSLTNAHIWQVLTGVLDSELNKTILYIATCHDALWTPMKTAVILHVYTSLTSIVTSFYYNFIRLMGYLTFMVHFQIWHWGLRILLQKIFWSNLF